jgi:nicotinamidase/pyrazinamidase
MSDQIEPGHHDVLVVVDVQNDFCTGGKLAVPGGEEVVPVINHIAGRFPHVILTQDWHPRGHISFASTHGRKPGDMIETSYGQQELWTDHCVQSTPGAELRSDLHVPHAQLVLRKGYHHGIDSYSVFFENDRKTPTGLLGYLSERKLTRVFLCGLAFDFCVRFSAEDGHREGVKIVVVEDACRAIDLNGSAEKARSTWRKLNIPIVSADRIG